MSIIPEYILQSTIVRGITAFRNDPKLIDQLFRNLDQGNLLNVKRSIQKDPIDVCFGAQREALKLPSIVILLKSENEKSAFLGDELGLETPETFEFPETFAGSTTSLSGYPALVFGPFAASGGTLNTLTTATKEWSIDQYTTKDYLVKIVSGTGVGQVRVISTNNQNTLLISKPWSVIPDITSLFDIRAPQSEVIGEPSALYSETDRFIRRAGTLNSAQYQIQVMAGSPEQVILLTILIKSIFLLSRMFTEGQGLIDLKMALTDLAPRSEHTPDFAYMRAINLEFSYHFDIFEELTNPTSIRTIFEATNTETELVTIVNDSTITVP